jgi:hypothetical protein
LFTIDLENPLGAVLLLLVSLFLKIEPADDIVDIEGKLFVVQFFCIILVDSFFETLFQVFVEGNVPNRGGDCFAFVIGSPFQPGKPGSNVSFLPNKRLSPGSPPGSVS